MTTLREKAAAAKMRGDDPPPTGPVRLTPPKLHVDPAAGVPPDAALVDSACAICGLDALEIPAHREFTVPIDEDEVEPAETRVFGDPTGRDRPQVAQVGGRRTEVKRAGDLDPERLATAAAGAGIGWIMLRTDGRSLGAPEGGRLVAWTCATCTEARGRHGLRGVTQVRLRQAGAQVPDPADGELDRLTGITWASLVMAARERGEADPQPPGKPFGWLNLDDVQVDDTADMTAAERRVAELNAADRRRERDELRAEIREEVRSEMERTPPSGDRGTGHIPSR